MNRSMLAFSMIGLGISLGAIQAQRAQAHHSISGVYDSSRRITVEGVVAEFRFVNPHPILIIDAARAGEAGRELWQLEMDNRFELAEIGIGPDTFRAGDRVVAAGSAARKEARRMYLLRLERPADGFRYEQIGFRPRIEAAAHR
jgi:hypothetical protein